MDYLIIEMDPISCSASSTKFGKAIASGIKALASNTSYVPLNKKALDAATDIQKVCGTWFSGGNKPDHVDSFNALSKSSTGSVSGAKNDAHLTLTVL